MNPDDTIVAVSSAVGAAPRMIVRLSGPAAFALAGTVLTAAVAREAGVRPARLRWHEFDLPAVVYAFVAPRSSTGQDVVELHLPGNPTVVKQVVRALVAAGARPAEAGEFTARAYFNGRLDLAQAEGVAATISAANEQELRAARQLLAGELARRLRPITDGIAEMLALVEAGIDFSEEDVSFLPPDALRARAAEVDAQLDRLVRESRRFERLTHEPTVVLVGRPNAGKSTLLNALAGAERAVVSPHAGTTRDAIWAEVLLRRGLVRMVDVAGIEADLPAPDDGSPAAEIARQMRRKAEQAVESADVLVLAIDRADPVGAPRLSRRPDLVVHTKADLLPARSADASGLAVSALTGVGLPQLRDRLDALAFGAPDGAGGTAGGTGLALNARHVTAIEEARAAIGRVQAGAEKTGELVALDLREALDALGSIVGQVTPDDVLGRIFGAFCIGK